MCVEMEKTLVVISRLLISAHYVFPKTFIDLVGQH